MKDYHINIFYSKEDKGYIADIPDLKHCSAFGETLEEALPEVLKQKRHGLKRRVPPENQYQNLAITHLFIRKHKLKVIKNKLLQPLSSENSVYFF